MSISIIFDRTQMEQLTVVNGVQVSPGEERKRRGGGRGERKGEGGKGREKRGRGERKGGGGRGLEGAGRNRRQNLLHSVRKVHITFQ